MSVENKTKNISVDTASSMAHSDTNIVNSYITTKKGCEKVIYEDGYYDGIIENGERNGKGTYFWDKGDQSGDYYNGEWKNGVRTGKGEYIYANGKRYKGDFLNNKKHGYGKLFLPDGSHYSGRFVADSFCGKGKFVDASLNISYTGFWKDETTAFDVIRKTEYEICYGRFVNNTFIPDSDEYNKKRKQQSTFFALGISVLVLAFFMILALVFNNQWAVWQWFVGIAGTIVLAAFVVVPIFTYRDSFGFALLGFITLASSILINFILLAIFRESYSVVCGCLSVCALAMIIVMLVFQRGFLYGLHASLVSATLLMCIIGFSWWWMIAIGTLSGISVFVGLYIYFEGDLDCLFS